MFQLAYFPDKCKNAKVVPTRQKSCILYRKRRSYSSTDSGKFCNLVYKSGYMVLICKDQETAEWVKEITPSINTWEGAELVALNEEDIPRQELLRAFFPQSSTFADERIKALIESQNG